MEIIINAVKELFREFTVKEYDKNSVRAILKYENLDLYFQKQKEHTQIVSQIGDLIAYPENATRRNVDRVLLELKMSAFYESKEEYRNVFNENIKSENRQVVEPLRNLYVKLGDININ